MFSLLSTVLSSQIVWDPDNKRWINTDQDAVEEESFKPPPKMADLTKTAMPAAAPAMPAVAPAIPAAGPAMPPPATTPMDPNVQLNANLYGHPTPHADGSSNINNIDQQQAAKVPNLQSNMFKMQRNKSEYHACCPTHFYLNDYHFMFLQLLRNRMWTFSIHREHR